MNTHRRPLPRSLSKVYDFIKSEVDAGRRFPSQTAIRDHMGWKNVCTDALRSLAVRGLITMELSDARPRKYVFAMKLNEPRGLSAAEQPCCEGVNNTIARRQ